MWDRRWSVLEDQHLRVEAVLDILPLKNLLKIFSKLSMERTDLEMCQRNKENIKIYKSLSLIFDVHNW